MGEIFSVESLIIYDKVLSRSRQPIGCNYAVMAWALVSGLLSTHLKNRAPPRMLTPKARISPKAFVTGSAGKKWKNVALTIRQRGK